MWSLYKCLAWGFSIQVLPLPDALKYRFLNVSRLVGGGIYIGIIIAVQWFEENTASR